MLAGFAATGLVVAGLTAATWKTSLEAADALRWVAHTHQVLDQIARVRSDSLEIELSTLRYRMSGDAARLADRDAAMSAREASLGQIKELTADDARQQERWTRVREVADERIAISRRVALLRRTQGAEAAGAYAADAPLQQTRERLFGLLGEMEGDARRRLQEHSTELRNARESRIVASALTTLALIALLVASYGLIRRQVRAIEASRAALARSEDSLSTTLNSIGDAVLAADAAGRITRMNPTAQRLTRWPFTEARGRAVDEVLRIVDEPTREPARLAGTKALADGETPAHAADNLLIARDGTEWPVAGNVAPIHDGAGQASGVVVVFRDRTAERQAQRTIREHNARLEQSVQQRTAQLAEAEARLRNVLDNAPALIAYVDSQQRYVYGNASFLAHYAPAQPRIEGRTVREVLGEERYALAGPRIAEVLQGRPQQYDWQPDPGVWHAVTNVPQRDADGRIVGYHVLISDITERRRAEQVLVESAAFVRASMDALQANVCVLDEAGTIVAVNKGWRDFAAANGVDPDQVSEGANYLAVCEAATGAARACAEAIAEGIRGVASGATERFNLEYDCHSPEQQRWFMASLNCFTAGQEPRVVISHFDITARVQAERRTQAQKERAEALLESAPDAVVIVDHEGRIVLVNGRVKAVFGYERAELLGEPVEKLIPERLRRVHVAQRMPYQARPRARTMGDGLELYARRKDGGELAVEILLSPLETPQGTLVISTIRDITERKQAQQRSRRQLEHLRLLDQITRSTGERQDLKSIFGVVVRSLEDELPIDFGCVCLHDPVANALTVTSVGVKSEALAHDIAMDAAATVDIDENGLWHCMQGQLVYERDISRVGFPFPERLARGGLRSVVMAPLKSESRVFGILVAARRAADGFTSAECEFLRQLSEHVALAAHQAQLYESLQRAYDDLRQTRAAAMQEERLRALGQMASGIAHDINNALSPVSLYTESLLETEPGLSDRARGQLETIRRGVDDVAKTVARMREFYRQREEQIELAPVDANQMVQQVLDLTRAHWSDMALRRGITIQVVTELAPDLPRIMAVEAEIREALTNLVINAVDAMPVGGTLALRTRRAGAATDQSVIVEVIDNGVGMDEETHRRCLEPFFTTKGERGTGLGLPMVFGVVQRHSAGIEIDSAPGAGTTVRLMFAVPTSVIVEPGRALAVLDVPRHLRLLLVDDDPVLLNSLRDALEIDGHVVVATGGGQAGIDALHAAVRRGEPFAAVITDLGMPYVDGRKVAAAVKNASPATPVILLSGWGQRLIAEGDAPEHVDHVLAKPPKLHDLREALTALCRQPCSGAST